jgi:hypothetical protein
MAKPFKLGFEVTQQRIDMLSDFVVESTLSLASQAAYLSYYKYVYTLPEDYLHFVSGEYLAECGIIQVDIKQHNLNINHSFQKPSKLWNRVIPKMSDETLSVIAESDYLPGLNFTYLKEATRPFFGNYDTLDFISGDSQAPSTGDTAIDLDISDKYGDIVIDLAVQNYSGVFDNFNQVSYIDNKLIKTT